MDITQGSNGDISYDVWSAPPTLQFRCGMFDCIRPLTLVHNSEEMNRCAKDPVEKAGPPRRRLVRCIVKNLAFKACHRRSGCGEATEIRQGGTSHEQDICLLL